MLWTKEKSKRYSDKEVVKGLQSRNAKVEEWFYYAARRYYNEHFNQLFFDKDRKQEIFQDAFLKIWTEIQNKKIAIKEDVICREQHSGEYRQMTCSLTTFLMAYAKMEFRELLRSTKEDVYSDFFDDASQIGLTTLAIETDDDVEEQKKRAVDECIMGLSPRCAEILTLFYYEGKSLDEIMEIRMENNSKNGLKTAKNKCMNTLRERVNLQFRTLGLEL